MKVFRPFVLESYGMIGGSADETIKDLAKISAWRYQTAESVEVRRWRELLTLRLMLDQAEILLHA